MVSVCDFQVSITATEMKVLSMMREGMTNREIAIALTRSEFTVKTHKTHV